MTKKETDRIISLWFFLCVFSPPCIVSTLFFLGGYYFSDLVTNILSMVIDMDSKLFKSEAGIGVLSPLIYLVALPVNFLWIFWVGGRVRAFDALQVIALKNLISGVWDSSRFTLNGGRFRFLMFFFLSLLLWIGNLLLEKEPSFCQGCESDSGIGFLLFRIVGSQMILVTGCMAGCYLFFWKNIFEKWRNLNEQ